MMERGVVVMKPVVHVIHQPTYFLDEIRSKAQQVMAADGLRVRGKRVFVKPSFVYPARPPRNRGVNTQPEVVGAVVQALKALGAACIDVGEDCLVGPSQNAFVAMGVLPLIRGYAEPCYLQDEPRTTVHVRDALVEDRYRLPKKLMDADLFVSLPKLKVNMYTRVTLSVKNHMGLLLQADRLPHHDGNIHKKIVDLYRARVPDYVVTDAIVAGEGQGPMHATPRPLSLLLAGRVGVAVDAVACHAAGFNPETDVEHLALLHERGYGPLRLDAIDIEGEHHLAAHRGRLVRPTTAFGDCNGTLRICAGSDRACPEGCLGMLRGSLDRWILNQRRDAIDGLTFIVGKPIDDLPSGLDPRRTFVIGDCASPYAKVGTFIPGCPIPPMALTYALLKKGKHSPLQTRVRDLAKGTLMRALHLPLR